MSHGHFTNGQRYLSGEVSPNKSQGEPDEAQDLIQYCLEILKLIYIWLTLAHVSKNRPMQRSKGQSLSEPLIVISEG